MPDPAPRSPLSTARRAAGIAWSWRYRAAYALVILWFLVRVAEFHDTRTGFTSMILFGDKFEERRLPELRTDRVHTCRNSWGYDGQFYAQIAVRLDPADADLARAVDGLGYRFQRVGMPAAAHVLGLGEASRVLNAYALLNVVSWLALAWMLARWFPPGSLHNLICWAGLLLSSGLLYSVSRALVDGPALACLAGGLLLLERGRPALAAPLLACGGLVRETGVLAAAAVLPWGEKSRHAWVRGLLWAAAIALPAALWMLWLSWQLHAAPHTGTGNFAFPLSAWFHRLGQAIQHLSQNGLTHGAFATLACLLTTAVHAAWIALRPQPKSAVWRVGAAFALLFLCLGVPVWEGFPVAASRVVLPLALAFNLLLPRTRLGLILALLGNLTALSCHMPMNSPAPSAPAQISEAQVQTVAVGYGDSWYPAEREGRRVWRWSTGPGWVELHNRSAQTRVARLSFELASDLARQVRVRASGVESRVDIPARKRRPGALGPFLLPPGSTRVEFLTETPAWKEPADSGGRSLAFALHNFRVQTDELPKSQSPQAP